MKGRVSLFHLILSKIMYMNRRANQGLEGSGGPSYRVYFFCHAGMSLFRVQNDNQTLERTQWKGRE